MGREEGMKAETSEKETAAIAAAASTVLPTIILFKTCSDFAQALMVLDGEKLSWFGNRQSQTLASRLTRAQKLRVFFRRGAKARIVWRWPIPAMSGSPASILALFLLLALDVRIPAFEPSPLSVSILAWPLRGNPDHTCDF